STTANRDTVSLAATRCFRWANIQQGFRVQTTGSCIQICLRCAVCGNRKREFGRLLPKQEPQYMTTDVSVQLDRVSKSFGDFTAVRDLSLTVRPGRVFGLLGPNGAGKTTTIRMIVNITAPDSGTIALFGDKINAALQDRIGYLPEERG